MGEFCTESDQSNAAECEAAEPEVDEIGPLGRRGLKRRRRMWSRWPSEVPPNLSYCVIMWINDFPGWAWPLPGRAGSQFLWLL